jgi:xylose isomerase
MMRDLRPQTIRRDADELLKHLKEFSVEPKFSAGVWFFAPGGGRFHDRYVDPMTIEGILEIAAGLAEYGLKGLEAHYPKEVNEDNIHLYQQLEKDTGVKLVMVGPMPFYEPEWEFGSLSSPITEVRKAAVERIKRGLAFAREVDALVVLWPGIDGFEDAFGIDFYNMWGRFEDGLAEAMDAVPGVRVAIEPKPYEPRGNNIYRNTPDGIIMTQDVESRLKSEENRKILAEGHAMVGLNPEVGHVRMGGEDLAYAFSRILRQGRLAHTHWNSQPLGNYDQDLNVGVIGPEQAFAAMYALKMHGYNEYLGIDINPERMPVDRALINNMDRLKALIQATDEVDHELVIACIENPGKNMGVLEAYLTRLAHPNAKGLSPMPNYQK